ncbi:hypothetical protein HK101_001720, partial [Irineochytrium annulatum]
FEHSSVAATIRDLFGLPGSLSRRDAWAGSLFNFVAGPQAVQGGPRTDCAMKLPNPPPFSTPAGGLIPDIVDPDGDSFSQDIYNVLQDLKNIGIDIIDLVHGNPQPI